MSGVDYVATQPPPPTTHVPVAPQVRRGAAEQGNAVPRLSPQHARARQAYLTSAQTDVQTLRNAPTQAPQSRVAGLLGLPDNDLHADDVLNSAAEHDGLNPRQTVAAMHQAEADVATMRLSPPTDAASYEKAINRMYGLQYRALDRATSPLPQDSAATASLRSHYGKALQEAKKESDAANLLVRNRGEGSFQIDGDAVNIKRNDDGSHTIATKRPNGTAKVVTVNGNLVQADEMDNRGRVTRSIDREDTDVSTYREGVGITYSVGENGEPTTSPWTER